MKTHRKITLFVIALGLGLLLGSALRPVLFSSAPSKEVVTQKRTTPAEHHSILTQSRSQQSKLATALRDVPVANRFLWLATQAEAASVEELEDLIKLAKREGHPDLERAIATRWAAEDSSHMFEELSKNHSDDLGLWRILFKEWATTRPREALAEFTADRDAKYNRNLTLFFWSELMRYAPEVAIEASSEIDISSMSANTDALGSWAAADPGAAAAKVVKHMKDARRGEDAMEEIGQVWGSSDPKAALAYAESLGYANPAKIELGGVLATNAMRAWAEADPEAAAVFAANETDPAKRARLGEGLAAGLAKTDPSAALEWVQANLQSSSRAKAVGDIVKAATKADVKSTGALVAGMTPGGAMNQAATAYISTWGRHAELSENENMLDWIASLPDAEARNHAMGMMDWRLSSYSKFGLIDFVSGDHGHLATESMVKRAATQRARQDPESAVAWAKQLPEDRSATALSTVMKVSKTVTPDDSGATFGSAVAP